MSLRCTRFGWPGAIALAAVLLLPRLEAGVATAAEPAAGQAIAKKSGCLGCHATASALVGPPLRAVAARYREQPKPEALIAAFVATGTRPGKAPLESADHPRVKLAEADASALAAWILSLK